MGIYKKKNGLVILGLTACTLMATGCTPSAIQKQVDETEEYNRKIETERPAIITEDTPPEEVELTSEQLDVLEEQTNVSTEEAIATNVLDKRENVEIIVPADKTVFKDENEFSQYVSAQFYLFHSNQISAEDFYKKMVIHFHDDFKALLPLTEEHQIRTFEVLQKQFSINLPSPIADYELTKIKINKRYMEGVFYRVYELENKQKVYYETYIQQNEKGQWLLMDDRTAAPYEVIQNQMKQNTEDDEDE